MDRPWIRLVPCARGWESGKWVFTLKAEDLSGASSILTWAEVKHTAFVSDHTDQIVKLPGTFELRAWTQEQPSAVLEDVPLRLGLIWQGDRWLITVPLVVRFDRNGNPDLEATEALAQQDLPGDRNEAMRSRILRVIYEHQEAAPGVYMDGAEIADQLGGTPQDIDYHLEVLQQEGEYVRLHPGAGSRHSALLTISGQKRVREGVRTPTPLPQVTIGAIIHSMTGGNVQATGAAADTQISQVINDPRMLQESLTNLSDQVLEIVKTELSGQELIKYVKSLESLQSQLQSDKPDPNAVKRLLGALALMGDVEGTVGLMGRVWPFISPLVVLSSSLLASLPK